MTGGECAFHEDMKMTVQDHETRIRSLEISGGTLGGKVDGLCEKIDDLVTVIKWLIVCGTTSLGGFFLWYIQSIPR